MAAELDRKRTRETEGEIEEPLNMNRLAVIGAVALSVRVAPFVRAQYTASLYVGADALI